MGSHDITLTAALTVAVCLATAWACLCRLNQMDGTVSRDTRGRYALLLAGALAGAMSPLLEPGLGLLILALSVLVFLLLTLRRWRDGPPPDVCARRGDSIDHHNRM